MGDIFGMMAQLPMDNIMFSSIFCVIDGYLTKLSSVTVYLEQSNKASAYNTDLNEDITFHVFELDSSSSYFKINVVYSHKLKLIAKYRRYRPMGHMHTSMLISNTHAYPW